GRVAGRQKPSSTRAAYRRTGKRRAHTPVLAATSSAREHNTARTRAGRSQRCSHGDFRRSRQDNNRHRPRQKRCDPVNGPNLEPRTAAELVRRQCSSTTQRKPKNQEGISMSDKHIDEGKGRLKQAAGSLTDDRSLKNEGKVDQAKATVKDTVDKVADAV